ncbi:MAG: hypothetical protein WCP55_16920 [Lentisphaerota bacterium]
MIQVSFDNMPIDCIAAISDDGVVTRARECRDLKIFKADMVPSKIRETYENYRKGDALFSMSKLPDFRYASEESMMRSAEFIVYCHVPKKEDRKNEPARQPEKYQQPEKKQPAPTQPAVTAPIPSVKEVQEEYKVKAQTSTCPECKNRMNILWGEKYHNYYWKCSACDKAVPIRDICPNCKNQLKIRKNKEKYFLYCEPCNLEALYHTENENKPEPVVKPVPAVSSPNPAPAKEIFTCKKCNGSNLQIVYGEYGYYFKCQDCSGNTPLKLSCSKCNSKELVHKSGKTFTADCPACKTSRVFFENKS